MLIMQNIMHTTQTAGGEDGAYLLESGVDDVFTTLLSGCCSALVELENHTEKPQVNILPRAQW